MEVGEYGVGRSSGADIYMHMVFSSGDSGTIVYSFGWRGEAMGRSDG
jgi:hypothetical protein